MDLLQFIFSDGENSQPAFSMNERLKQAYRSSEKARYHRDSLVRTKLVRKYDGQYLLTAYGASVLRSSGLRDLVGEKGVVNLDIRLLFELLDAELEGLVYGLTVRELSLRLKAETHQLYNSKVRLTSGKSPYIESGWDMRSSQLSKASERLYSLTDNGREVCQKSICNFLANKIISDYRQPQWVSLAELVSRKRKYPKETQELIDKSFKTVCQTLLVKPIELPRITFFIFPWLEPIVLEYAMTHYLERETKSLEEEIGFQIVPKYIFTGNDALMSFSSHEGCKATLFALESLHLRKARFLRENSLLVGGIEGSPAYAVMGRGASFKKAVYEDKTIYSKELVRKVAKVHRIEESSAIPLDTEDDYQKVINKEIEDNYIFHAKTPFGTIMKTQFPGVVELCEEPITVGLFISSEKISEIYAGIKLRDLIRLALETLHNPRKYYEAVEEYVRKLPTLDRAFLNLPIVRKIEQSKNKKEADVDWREVFGHKGI